MKEKEKKDYKQVVELIHLSLRISKPSLTLKQAENVIINCGNYLQLEALEETK